MKWILSGEGEEMWVAETKTWFPCTSFYFYQRSQCDEYLEKTIPAAMKNAAVENDGVLGRMTEVVPVENLDLSSILLARQFC